MSFIAELKRRNVLRVGAAYIVTAWLVIQVVETIFPAFGFGDEAIRLVTIAFAIGLIPALVLAWVFEWTPEGLKKDTELDHAQPVSFQAAKKLDRMILLVLALALGYFAFDKFVLNPGRDAERQAQTEAELEQAREQGIAEGLQQSRGEASIAVLAFADMSPAKDQEYLSDGIAEDILNLLQRMPQLDVRSRTSAFRFKDSKLSVPEIADLLNVDHVLEGSVRYIGNRVRITAQLIDARTDSHLWSENFDREVNDVFEIMDEISLATTEQIGIELLSEPPRAKRIDADAYFLYLHGNHLVQSHKPSAAIGYLKQAIEIEPEYVDAILGISTAYWAMSPSNLATPEEEKDDYRLLSEEFYRRAKAVDPEHPAILGFEAWYLLVAGDYSGAASLLTTALSRDPNDWNVVSSAVIFSMAIRQTELAVRLAEAAVRRDPYCADCVYWYARSLIRAGRFADSEQQMLRYWEKIGGKAGGQFTFATSIMMQGRYEEAAEHFQEWLDRDQDGGWWGLLMIRVLQGEDVKADLDRFERSDVSRSQLAMASAMAGDRERAFRLLKVVSTEEVSNSSFHYRFLNSPYFDSLHDDPRWKAMEESAGLAPHQLAEISFNPSIPGYR